MPLVNIIRNWFSTKTPSDATPPVAASASASVVAATSVVKAPAAVNESTGIDLFLKVGTSQARDEVLQKHPFWQQDNVHLLVDAPVVAAVIEHISELETKYAWRRDMDTWDDDDEDERIENLRGVQWGRVDAYEHWHKRAVQLIGEQPEQGSLLLNALIRHLEASVETMGQYWLVEADKVLELGGLLSTSILLAGLSTAERVEKLAAHPALEHAVQDPGRDAEMLEWVKKQYSRAETLVQFHHRLHGWRLADEIPDKNLITKLAESVKDGALLKAWHGIALTSEETRQHPLAYSLYVHKHALIYLEEARPLPDAWSMALALSTTGLEFQEMLLSAAHLKVNPARKPEILTLPDLEP